MTPRKTFRQRLRKAWDDPRALGVKLLQGAARPDIPVSIGSRSMSKALTIWRSRVLNATGWPSRPGTTR
ncbi:MAG: hypothetical protein IBJ14_09540 [Hydrogenophaga sp.]|nr:hypothetical protein [Hydrogenophaga sp.]